MYMRKVYIYALTCPKTNEIRYIGKTIQKLKTRLKGHLFVAKDDLTHRANWIRKLKSKKLKPNIILIEEVNDLNWIEKEIYWIAYYSKITKLVNSSKGGVGGHDVKLSTREKKSLNLIDRWQDENYREKMCDMSKNLWKDDEHKKEASNRLKSYWQDEEYKEKMSNMTKELWKNEEYRETRLTEESRKKMSEAKKNTIQTEETKFKIGIKSKENWKSEEFRKKVDENRTRIYPVVVDNIEYRSMGEACEKLGIMFRKLKKRLLSPDYPNYYYKEKEGN